MTNAERVKQVRARARIRNWEFRQRHLARGAWHRFRLALASAREAYALEEDVYAGLAAEGAVVDDRGCGLQPEIRLVWISDERAVRLIGATKLEMRLDAAMLAARYIALVPFERQSR